jgi:tetratricopeptide (TPR) repeat protein
MDHPLSHAILTLWDFDDPAASRSRFTAAAAVMTTQIARSYGLAGEFAEGHAVLDALGEPADGPDEVAVRVGLERGRLWRSAGDPEAARPLFRAAYERALAAGLHGLAADAAHMLALVSTDAEDRAEWTRRGLAAADGDEDPLSLGMAGALLNNEAWSLGEAGDWAGAYELFDRAVGVRERAHATLGSGSSARSLHVARWARARALRGLGRFDEALAVQRALAETEIGRDSPHVAEEIAAGLDRRTD